MNDPALCAICCDTKPLNELICKHRFCTACLQNYINEKVNDSEAEIPCPFYSCDEKISYTFINQLVDDYVVKKLDRNIIKQTVNESNDLKFCPKCDTVCTKDDDDNTVNCSNCEYSFCYVCSGKMDEDHTCDSEDEEIMNAIRRETDDEYSSVKKCPKCHILIKKYTGCDCVKCANCRFRFCWNCLKLERDIDDQDEHRRECADFEAFADSATPDPSDDET